MFTAGNTEHTEGKLFSEWKEVDRKETEDRGRKTAK